MKTRRSSYVERCAFKSIVLGDEEQLVRYWKPEGDARFIKLFRGAVSNLQTTSGEKASDCILYNADELNNGDWQLASTEGGQETRVKTFEIRFD